MWGDRAYHTVLIAVLLLPGFVVSADAQRSKAGRQEQRGVNVGPAASAPHTAERRTALVIGNSSYAEGPLANPVNDATDMANILQQMGFAVTLLRDADLRRLRAAIEIFRKELRPGVVGLFYFAGHGLQVKGENYLVPIGAQIAREVP
jgi:caspase domain-containing protein